MTASYCCKEMKLFLKDSRDPIEYDSIFREYYIDLPNQCNIITMSFCPWCGQQLPTSLREKFFDILELEYEIITNAGDYKDRPDIPEEFRSDEWWKKRNL